MYASTLICMAHVLEQFSLDFTGNPLATPLGIFEQPPVSPDSPLSGLLGISLAPPINADMVVSFDVNGNGDIEYAVSGSHDGFPAYELYINQVLVYFWDPLAQGTGPLALLGPPQAPLTPSMTPLEAISVDVPSTVLFDSIAG